MIEKTKISRLNFSILFAIKEQKISFIRLIKATKFVSLFFFSIIQLMSLMIDLRQKDTVCACTYLFQRMFIQISPPNFPVHRINTFGSFYIPEIQGWNKLNKHSVTCFLFLLTTSPPQSISFARKYFFAWFYQTNCRTNGNLCCSFLRFHHCEKYGAFVLPISSSSQTI